MTTLKLTAHGQADPDSVWQQYTRPALWQQWSPQISGVRIGSGAQLCSASRELVIAPGMTGIVLGPLRSRIRFVIDEVHDTDDGAQGTPSRRSWAWTVHAGPVTVRLGHAVWPSAQGTATELTITGPALIVLAYSAPAQLAIARLVRKSDQAAG